MPDRKRRRRCIYIYISYIKMHRSSRSGMGEEAWIGSIWLRIGTGGGLL
jgi:hypothetical protein